VVVALEQWAVMVLERLVALVVWGLLLQSLALQPFTLEAAVAVVIPLAVLAVTAVAGLVAVEVALA
jgi:uncharacterized protein YhhL (DUF1145 family)